MKTYVVRYTKTERVHENKNGKFSIIPHKKEVEYFNYYTNMSKRAITELITAQGGHNITIIKPERVKLIDESN